MSSTYVNHLTSTTALTVMFLNVYPALHCIEYQDQYQYHDVRVSGWDWMYN